MHVSQTPEPLIRKLESITDLTEAERAALLHLPLSVRSLKADADIVREQDRPSQCCLVLEGFLFRYKILPAGKRQIFSFHIAGDIPDLQSLHLTVMDHNVATLVPSTVGFIPHHAIRELCLAQPRLAGILWRDTLIDAAVFREWMAGIGRRSAYARIAHLFCELYLRLKAVGLIKDLTFELPITQAGIADALGLSTVHVNRSLQELRAANLISLRGGRLTVRSWERLQQAGEFDPTYLHLDVKAAA
jgi:CRP-like cAMP-binding protein